MSIWLAFFPLFIAAMSSPSENVFRSILGAVPTVPELSVEPCEGSAPMLCVELDGARVVVELLVSDRSTHDALQTGRSGEAFLPEFVASHLHGVEADRLQAHGSALRFDPDSGSSVPVGALSGWRYGFALRDRSGRPVERQWLFAAVDEKNLYLLAVHFDDDPWTDAAARRLLPHITDVVAALRLPESESDR